MSRKFPRWPSPARATARSAPAVLAALILALAGLPGLARAATQASGATLTCFALDVSGSNLVASNGEPASDPGPVFVRQQVVQLYTQVLAALGDTAGQQVGVVTFGTGVGTRIGPVAVADPAARARLTAALPTALRPAATEAAWTNWVAGVQGCRQMFQRSGASHGTLIMLTDGFPQGPAGGPGRQLSAISPSARSLSSDGIDIQAVLYGAAADQPGPARVAMDRLATMGHGQLTLAATPLDMLRAALHLASVATGVPLGGAAAPVNGATSTPMTVPAHLASAALVVLRSSAQVQVSVSAPGGQVLGRLRAGDPGLALVVPVTDPAAGTYQAAAQGRGSLYVADLLRLDPVPPASQPIRVSAHRAAASRGHHAGAGLALLLILAAVAAVAALLIAYVVVRRRRRPRGEVSLWRGARYRLVESVDLDGSADLADLLPGGGATGWHLHWVGRGPVLTSPDGSIVTLTADETMPVPISPAASLTWLPDGAGPSLGDEPPGRPAPPPRRPSGPVPAPRVPTPDRS
ncbi:MAG TPA: vWA domain-containing protein [Streptosporangiaceae bacterium]|jgi:hypothetical protein